MVDVLFLNFKHAVFGLKLVGRVFLFGGNQALNGDHCILFKDLSWNDCAAHYQIRLPGLLAHIS